MSNMYQMRAELMAKKVPREPKEPFKVMEEKEIESKNGEKLKQTTFVPEETENKQPLWSDTTLQGQKDGGIDIANLPKSPKFFQQSIDSMQRNLEQYQEELDYLKALHSEQETKQETKTTETKGE